MLDAPSKIVRMSWNTHSLISRFAVSGHFSSNPFSPVGVIPMESFLQNCQEELEELSRDVRGRIYSKLGIKQINDKKNTGIKSPADFKCSFRLNPRTEISYVRVFEIERSDCSMSHDSSRDGPPGHSYIPTPSGADVSVFEIFCTFSDEPDWGMDQDIFSFPDYSMGRPPFGPRSGKSSQASFHMGFPHENRFYYRVVPGLAKSLLSIRAAMSFDLSKIAFRNGFDYWGWRFAAWATHYLQDITCPFHCCPFPPGIKNILKKFFRNPNPLKFYHNNRNYLRNRHGMLEATVSYLMNESVKNGTNSPLIDALNVNTGKLPEDLDLVIKEVSRIPYMLAPKINDFMVNLFSCPIIDEPEYYIYEDPDFTIGKILEYAIKQRPSMHSVFVELVSQCLSEAGRVTRFSLESLRR